MFPTKQLLLCLSDAAAPTQRSYSAKWVCELVGMTQPVKIHHNSTIFNYYMDMAQNYQPPKWMVVLLKMIISVGHWYHNFEPNPNVEPYHFRGPGWR